MTLSVYRWQICLYTEKTTHAGKKKQTTKKKKKTKGQPAVQLRETKVSKSGCLTELPSPSSTLRRTQDGGHEDRGDSLHLPAACGVTARPGPAGRAPG